VPSSPHSLILPAARCTVCGENVANFVVYKVTPTPAPNTVTINGVDLTYTVVNGVPSLAPTQAQMAAILSSSSNNIVIDMSGYANVDFSAAAAWFKDIDMNITFITSKGSVTVKTKTLWNNSGKTRVVTISGAKATLGNA